MTMLVLEIALLGAGAVAVLDLFFRLRMQRVGAKRALRQGEAFNYSRYHKVRKERGWAAWLTALGRYHD